MTDEERQARIEYLKNELSSYEEREQEYHDVNMMKDAEVFNSMGKHVYLISRELELLNSPKYDPDDDIEVMTPEIAESMTKRLFNIRYVSFWLALIFSGGFVLRNTMFDGVATIISVIWFLFVLACTLIFLSTFIAEPRIHEMYKQRNVFKNSKMIVDEEVLRSYQDWKKNRINVQQ